MDTLQDLALFSYPFGVKIHEVDVNGRISPYYLLVHIQEAAIQHAVALGLDAEKLRTVSLFWVLTRLKATIFRYPKTLEMCTVTTWVSRVGGLQTLREFMIEDAQGKELARAVSSWMILDWKTRRPKGFHCLPKALPLVSKRALPYPKTPIPLPKKPTKEARHTVTYSDLDINHHVNNLRYLAWIFDLFPLEKYQKEAIAQIDVQFIKEARYGQELSLRLEDNPALGYIASVVPHQAEAPDPFLKAWLQFGPRI